MIETLVCEVCEAEIGIFDTATLVLPLTPDQFLPLEPGFPPPFQPEMDWEFLNCPICHHRAVGWDASMADGVRRDQVKTTGGYFYVVDQEDEPVSSPEAVMTPAARVAVKKKGGRRGR